MLYAVGLLLEDHSLECLHKYLMKCDVFCIFKLVLIDLLLSNSHIAVLITRCGYPLDLEVRKGGLVEVGGKVSCYVKWCKFYGH